MSNTYLDTVDGQVDFDQPYVIIWAESDNMAGVFRILIEAKYKYHPEGSIITDPYIKAVDLDDQPYAGELPEDVVSIVESEFEDTDFYVDMLAWHEQSMKEKD
jgi:hypothetical protein